MPSCDTLTGKFTPPEGMGYRFPFAWMTIPHASGESIRAKTLIDTGASISILELGYAKGMLRKTEAEIKSSTNTTPVGALGGSSGKGYGWKTDFRLRAEQSGKDYLELTEVWIYVVEKTINGFPFIMGQFNGFQERWLGHFNAAVNGQWQINLRPYRR